MFGLVSPRCERVRLRHLAKEGQVALVLLRQERFDFDALVGLEKVQLVHGRALEVRASHVILVAVVHVEDALVRAEEIFTSVQRVYVLLDLVLSEQRHVRWYSCHRWSKCLRRLLEVLRDTPLEIVEKLLLLLLLCRGLRDTPWQLLADPRALMARLVQDRFTILVVVIAGRLQL